jgi:hypothetical protein
MKRHYHPTPAECELAQRYPDWTLQEVHFFVLNTRSVTQ